MSIGAEVNGKLIHDLDAAAGRAQTTPVAVTSPTPIKIAGE